VRKYIFIILAVLVIDQALKFWVKTSMYAGESIYLFGWEKIQLYFTENNGMAFGVELEGEYGKMILSIFRILAVCGIGWYLYSLYKKGAHPGLLLSISLIFAGAAGNIIDSCFYGMIFSESDPWERNIAAFMPDQGYAGFLHGKVVDMFYLPLFRGHFPDWFPFWGGEDFEFFRPVFNVSDASITAGVILILLFQRRYFPKKEETKNSDTTPISSSESTTRSTNTN
jgi:signal peptidase II